MAGSSPSSMSPPWLRTSHASASARTPAQGRHSHQGLEPGCQAGCAGRGRTADEEEEPGSQAGDGRVHGGGLERVDGADAHGRDRELLERQREPADALQAGTHHGPHLPAP